MDDQHLDFKLLRDKWREVPQEGGRVFSDDLLKLDRPKLLDNWRQYFSFYRKSEPDRWYQILYKEFMRDKTVLEIGSGLGFDGTLRLQEGLVKSWTFCDIAEANLRVIERVCSELGLRANFVYIDDDFRCFEKLGLFDVVWANGSLINVPFEFAREECIRILPHLKAGGRWIELCYPRERWIREGRLPFNEWGKITDGERTPWVEWYDLVKIKRRLFPAPLEVILAFNFHDDVYNWFDLMLSSDRPFDPMQSIFDLEIFPSGQTAEAHADANLTLNAQELEVLTPDAMWSYAAFFDLSVPLARTKNKVMQADDGFTAEIELRVARGHVGILFVGKDNSSPVCQEYISAASADTTTLMVTVPANAGAERLIFRNIAADGRSQFVLKRIQFRFVANTEA